MTNINFEDRVRKVFPGPHPQYYSILRQLSPYRAGQLSDHQRWVRSHGRFGYSLTWEGISTAFTVADHAAEDFAQMTLIKCTFNWSDLRLASFAEATLKNVKFKNCDVEGCDFSGAKLENVTFDNCFDFDKATFDGAVFIAPERNDPSARPRVKKNELNSG